MVIGSLVPAPRLLWFVGLAGVPAATLIGAGPGWAVPASLVVLVIAVAASADAWIGWPSLAGAVVEAPPVVHGSRGGELDLVVAVRGLGAGAVAGLSLPDSIQCARPCVHLSAPDDTARWRLRVLKRGRHCFDRLYLQAATPLGLWHRRRAVALGTEVHVFPDMRRDRAGVAAVFLDRGGSGRHSRPQVGKGREFDHLRDYTAGDDFGDIHWKSTARRGFPVTKMFQIERTREVYAVIDHSRLSARPVQSIEIGETGAGDGDGPMTGGNTLVVTRCERMLESALAIGMAAERQHDRFGLVTFADQVTQCVRSGAGRAHFGLCRNALLSLEPRLVAPDFEELFVFLRRHITRRSLVILFTDLSDPLQAESFVRDARLISRQHVVIVCMIRPERAAPLFSRTSVDSVDDLYAELGGHLLWHDLQEVAAVLGRQGVHVSFPDSSALSVEAVSRYMEVKNRQLL